MKTVAGVWKTEAGRRSAARPRSLALGLLLAAALLAAVPAVASAATEMAGEWEISLTAEGQTAKGIAIISSEPSPSGEFQSSSMTVDGMVPGTFSGKITSATEATVKLTDQAYGPFAASEFNTSNAQIQSSAGSLSMSGSGTVTSGSKSAPGTFTATRIRTYKEIEEQRERELREQEEAELRENVRGEWALTIESGPQVVHGVARVTSIANPQDEFSSSAALVEGAIPGSFAGTLSLEAGKSSVKVTSQAAGAYPESTFTSSAVTVTSVASSMSMSGSGTVQAGGVSAPAQFTATRTKDYSELVEAEAKEKAAAEAKEREAREAKEKQEAAEREAKEKQAKEEAAKQSVTPASQTFAGTGNVSATFSAEPLSKVLTVSAAGSLALPLSNPNTFAVTGRVTLTLASSAHTGKASRASNKHRTSHHGKKAPLVLGTSSFTIAADGRVTVKVTLSKAGRAELARHKMLPAVAKVVTQASGKPSASKTYTLTLHAAKPAGHHSKH